MRRTGGLWRGGETSRVHKGAGPRGSLQATQRVPQNCRKTASFVRKVWFGAGGGGSSCGFRLGSDLQEHKYSRSVPGGEVVGLSWSVVHLAETGSKASSDWYPEA